MNIQLHSVYAVSEEQSYCLAQSFALNCIITHKNVAFCYTACQSIHKNSFLVLIALIFSSFPSSVFWRIIFENCKNKVSKQCVLTALEFCIWQLSKDKKKLCFSYQAFQHIQANQDFFQITANYNAPEYKTSANNQNGPHFLPCEYL